MGSCAAPSAKGDDKFITTDYLQQCQNNYLSVSEKTELEIAKQTIKNSKDPAEREKAQQKYDALLEKDIQ
nr:hypothetical protein [Escherichia coli]